MILIGDDKMDEKERKELEQILKNKNKDFKVQEVVILVIITCMFSFFAGMSFSRMKDNPKKLNDNTLALSDSMKEFLSEYQNIVDNYYGDLDEEKLLSAALKGILEEVGDDYSVYMEDATYSNINLNLKGSYSGIGIAIYKDPNTNYMVISSVFENSAAMKAGLKPKDVILSVDGKSTATLSTSDFSQMVLKGTQEEFTFKITRDGKEMEISLKKSDVVIPSVDSKIIEKNEKKVGYIYISIFADNTYKQFREALKNLENEKIDALVIDVRNNTGGYLTTVSKMISLFMDSSYVAYQLEQNGVKNKIHSKGDETKEYPIVLLANSYSASASEVLVASLKENLGAKLVGEKTYGKGTVQQLSTLNNGDKYKLTTKKWLTPKGNWVNDTKGIEPDIEVHLTETYAKNPSDDTDDQLQRALEEASK